VNLFDVRHGKIKKSILLYPIFFFFFVCVGLLFFLHL
jgi:hypothetical protein